jgi:hypothetical protein
MLNQVSRVGEPMQWGLPDPTKPGVTKFLNQFGLELVEHLNAKETDDFFCRKKDGKLALRTSGFIHMVIARVP